MDEQKRRTIFQVVILVVLLGGLGASTLYMVKAMSPRRSQPQPTAQSGTESSAEASAEAEAPPSAIDMPPVPTTSGTTTTDRAKTEVGVEPNPNLFKVHALAPPKNPFVLQEQWFAETLDTLIGYPALREEGYFETMDPYIPNIDWIVGGERQWRSVSVERKQDNQYELTGRSQDGLIETKVRLEEAKPVTSSLAWTSNMDVPLTSLTTPDAGRRLAQAAAMPTGEPAGSGVTPSVEDFFDGVPPPAGGLAIPGGVSDLRTGEEGGDVVTCRGVTFRGGKAIALMDYNGQPYMVTEGSILPTHYQVMAIKEDGVVLLEMRDGSSLWVKLSPGAPPDSEDS